MLLWIQDGGCRQAWHSDRPQTCCFTSALFPLPSSIFRILFISSFIIFFSHFFSSPCYLSVWWPPRSTNLNANRPREESTRFRAVAFVSSLSLVLSSSRGWPRRSQLAVDWFSQESVRPSLSRSLPTLVSLPLLLISRLALYVYEYLLHVGAQKAAQTFLSEVILSAIIVSRFFCSAPALAGNQPSGWMERGPSSRSRFWQSREPIRLTWAAAGWLFDFSVRNRARNIIRWWMPEPNEWVEQKRKGRDCTPEGNYGARDPENRYWVVQHLGPRRCRICKWQNLPSFILLYTPL